MEYPSHIFREYDIRGIAEEDLTPEFAEALGQAIGSVVIRGGGQKVVVGRDCRLSGLGLQEALLRGLGRAGVAALCIGECPTPMGYWAIHHLHADGGIQITGSHNPPEYNGFKLTLLGGSCHGEQIQSLLTQMNNGDFEWATTAPKHEEHDVLAAYLIDLKSRLNPAKRKLKVVVDAGNGTGGISAVPLYRDLGHEVIPLFCEPDGNFPNHHPDPTVEENLSHLKDAVAAHKADIGLSFDGDADRIGVIDRDGSVIWGDRLMILLSRALLQEEPGAVIIGEVKCSKTLYDDIEAQGGKGIMWRTGHSLIKAKIKETGALLAGEMSGHIFYAHRYYGFDDAAYAGGRVLEILAADSSNAQTIGERLADVPKPYATPEIRYACPEELKAPLVAAALADFQARAKVENFVVKDIDGARVEWSDGWGLVRCSNTQPLLVLRFEAHTQARLDEIQEHFRAVIARLQASLTGSQAA